MKIVNTTRNSTLAGNAELANSFFKRLRGLLGRNAFPDGEALVIPNCKCIHMLGMNFPIDALFVSRTNRIVCSVPNLKPWSFSPYVSKAAKVIELPVGVISRSRTEVDDELQFI